MRPIDAPAKPQAKIVAEKELSAMHLLQRGAAPACLSNYQLANHLWNDVTPADKAEIWQELELMQGQRCAYCEAQIGNGKRHIEHFQQRARFPQGTFSWRNLFGSCNRPDCCGKHKDQCGPYDAADLIKPDVDDPNHFFLFVSDGTIAVRKGLSPRDAYRAQETLRIFNLDGQHGPLRQMRKTAVAGYLQTAEEFQAFAEILEPNEWMPALRAELALIADLPFTTAIRHILQP